ncbi:MAG: purine-binding chemotaxis protein CheW [Vallitaleaceae bacterium]|nr:purine-binding chemotaxis protein CheW [Vallitaleaceae bacterium]
MDVNQVKTIGTTQFIVVKFDQEQYGINIQYIQNIVRIMRITRVPNAPSYIKGVINLRGEIIPVMSVRNKFELQPDSYSNSTRIIIVKVEGHAIGLIVDQVLEVIQLSDDQIEKIVRDSADDKAKFVYAVGKIGNELVTLLNIEALIGVEE